jgi:hypothetical protein
VILPKKSLPLLSWQICPILRKKTKRNFKTWIAHNLLPRKMPHKKDTRYTNRNSKSPKKDDSVDDMTKSLDTTSIASGPNFS